MKISIIIPVYNSEQILDELIERINNVLKQINLKDYSEIIMINDYSADGSWKKIKDLSSENSNIRGLNLTENFGQHNALLAGLNFCSGDSVITLDDDLQHPPEFFPNILEKLKVHKICYTNYKNRKHLTWKKIVSKLNNIVSSFLLDKPLHIYMSSFRGLSREIVLEIIKFKGSNVYLDGLIIQSTKNIGMITVDHHARKKGASNYTFKKLLVLWSNMIMNFSFLPFRPASLIGISLKFFIKLFRKDNKKKQYEILEQI
tara:strand:+ start:1329 stop:2105 length:777 start_codon:yes stop_codon:yes gene_type:complete